MADDYKTAKEAFVSGTTGSNVFHVNMISFVSLCSLALHSTLQTRSSRYTARPVPFFISFLTLVVPLLLSMTLFAHRPFLLSILLFLPTGFVLYAFPRTEAGTPLPSPIQISPSPVPTSSPAASGPGDSAGWAVQSLKSSVKPLAPLTVYRAHMILMTVLAILAVDFPVFPRSLAKCETFGVSLMDLGVGSFVFSQGLVSAIPLLKDPSYLASPLFPKVVFTAKKILPVIILGLVRVLLVKGTEYPEHVTEYGTHWNFFLTLAFLPVLQVFLHPLILQLHLSVIGVLVAIVHQIALSFFGMEAFILADSPRIGFIAANKEGIISLTGYLSIHLLGLLTGVLTLPPSPGHFRRLLKTFRQSQPAFVRKRRDTGPSSATPSSLTTASSNAQLVSETIVGASAERQNDKTVTELCAYALIWWSAFGLVRLVGVGGGVSRRMVNLPYVLWTVSFNTSFILCYFLLDMYFYPSLSLRPSPFAKDAKRSASGEDKYQPMREAQMQYPGNPPHILESINKNGLVIFLLANVLTGIVNLGMKTMYASDLSAMVILGVYSLSICATAWKFRRRRIIRL